MTITYLAAQGQIVGTPDDWTTSYAAIGGPGTDRRQVIAAAIAEAGHDDFNIATLHDCRIVNFGFDMEDFAPEDRDDLAEVGRQLALEVAEGAS